MCTRHVSCSGPSALLIGFIAAICSATVQAQILYVDDDAPLGGDGLSWDTPFKYLQDALYTAAGDPKITEIRVAQGTYKPDQDEAGNVTPGDREATFQLISAVALQGGYAGITEPDPDWRDIDLYVTILSGDLAGNDGPDFEDYDENSCHIVTAIGTVDTGVFDGVTLTAGNADGSCGDRQGAGMYCYQGSPSVSRCTFTANHARGAGGGLYCYGDGSPTIVACAIVGNAGGYAHGHYAGGGGVFCGGGSNATFINCVIGQNTATGGDSNGGGGGVYCYDSSSTFISCVITDNSADRHGGGVHNRSSATTFDDCVFSGNSSSDSGAGIFISSSSPQLIGCTFRDNFAFRDGAGALVYNRYAQFTDCAFTGNLAVDNGGGIHVIHGEPEVLRCALSANFAGDCGGGMYGQGAVRESTFTGNLANQAGGGLCAAPGGNVTVLDCTFEDNQADDGGGLAVAEGAAATVAGCTFTRNDADYGGGIYADQADMLDVTYCTIIRNVGDGGGGGICTSACSPTVANCLFSTNHAAWGGAGIANFDSSPLIADSVFATNRAYASWGGGIYNDGASPIVIGCAFVGNYAEAANVAGEGAGIASAWDSNPTIVNCLFAGNYSYGSSPAIGSFFGGTTAIVNCTVSANVCEWGGAIRNAAANMVLADSIVWGNSPDQIGGAVAVTYSCVEGGWGGEGNIDVDPSLVGGPFGMWTSDAIYNPDTYQVVFTDEDASWSENEWVGAYVNPDTSVSWEPLQLVIVANTPTTITAWADWWGASWVTAGDRYELYDYRLGAGSPCIDAADNEAVPADEFDLDEDGDTEEPLPFDLDGNPRFVDDPTTPDTGNGDPPIVDMGAYEFQACPGDLDGDRDVDHSDLGIFLSDWGCTGADCIGDIDGDGDTDADDLQLLLANWGAVCP
jgi:hypothetical protein